MLIPLLSGLLGGGRGRSVDDDPIKAQAELNKKLAWDSFHTNKEKLENDARGAKSAGVMDTASKQMNAMQTAVKALQY